MKNFLLPVLLTLTFFSCTNSENKTTVTSENQVDAARNFIRAALDGKWNDAQKFMLPDSTNLQVLDNLKRNWENQMNADDKRGYRDASINLYDTRNVADTIVIVNYSNSYKKERDSVRVVRINQQWLVDLKYSFPQTDTSHHAQ